MQGTRQERPLPEANASPDVDAIRLWVAPVSSDCPRVETNETQALDRRLTRFRRAHLCTVASPLTVHEGARQPAARRGMAERTARIDGGVLHGTYAHLRLRAVNGLVVTTSTFAEQCASRGPFMNRAQFTASSQMSPAVKWPICPQHANESSGQPHGLAN